MGARFDTALSAYDYPIGLRGELVTPSDFAALDDAPTPADFAEEELHAAACWAEATLDAYDVEQEIYELPLDALIREGASNEQIGAMVRDVRNGLIASRIYDKTFLAVAARCERLVHELPDEPPTTKEVSDRAVARVRAELGFGPKRAVVGAAARGVGA